MKSIPNLEYNLLNKRSIQERVTIELNKEDYDKLKSITDIKQVFIKDVIDELIAIYNKEAITDKNFKQRLNEEKSNLTKEIKNLINLQTTNQQPS